MVDRAQPPSFAVRLAAVTAVVGLCSLITGVSLSAATGPGPATNAPDKTIPTLPPTTADAGASTTALPTTASLSTAVPSTATPSTSSTTSTNSAPSSSAPESTETVPVTVTAPVETGISLRAGAELSELFATATAVFGADEDVASGLGLFAVIPDGIPTPVGASILDFSVYYYGDSGYYVAATRFSITGTADDASVFYETVLTAAGYQLERESIQTDVRRGEFRVPQSNLDDASVSVSVVNSVDGTLVVELEVRDVVDPAVLAAFAGWPAGMPTIEDGRALHASVFAIQDTTTTLFVSTTFAFEGVTPDELTSRVREAVASGVGAFDLSGEDEDGSVISLEHVVIDSPSAVVSILTTDDGSLTTLEISGSLTR